VSTRIHVVVLNPNTSSSLTAALERSARRAAGPGVDVSAIQPFSGPRAVEDWRTAYLSSAAMIDRLDRVPAGMSALVLAGFGDVGIEALREIADVPVVDMTHAAAAHAGPAYGVVTTVASMVAPIRANLAAAGLLTACVGIEAVGLGIEEGGDAERAVPRIVAATAQLAQHGATAVCLGSAAFSAYADEIRRRTSVRIVDPVAAAISEAVRLASGASPEAATAVTADLR